MDIEELTKQNEELQKKMDKQVEEMTALSKKMQEQAESKADIVKNRDELKRLLAENKNKKDEDGATVEQLKKLLADERKSNEQMLSDHKSESMLSKLEKVAKNAGFVTDDLGNVNMSFLKSQINVNDLSLDGGVLYGAEAALEKLKKSDPFFFPKNAAPKGDPKINPKNIKGEDLGQEAFDRADFPTRVKIMRKRSERAAKDQENNGMPPGMTMANAVDDSAGEGSEPKTV